MLEQCSQIRTILANTPLTWGTLAFAMAAPIVREDPKRSGERRHDRRPILMISPRAVHQDYRMSGRSIDLPVDLNSVDVSGRHRRFLMTGARSRPNACVWRWSR